MSKLMAMIVMLLAVTLLLPVSCAGASEKTGAEPGLVVPSPMPPTEKAFRDGGAIVSPSMAAEPAATERIIVRTGDISLVVNNVVDARDAIARLAVGQAGYVVASQIWGEEQEMRGYISIRVPDGKFEPTLVELRNLAVRVVSESTSSRDVTEEYIDLQGRLKNAEATENQYLALLEKAQVEEAIRIYELLHQVRREIEQIKGQIKYLEQTSSMSLITVQLQPAATAKPLVPVWSALEVLKSALREIVVVGQWLATVVIWLLILLPVWGTIIGIIFWRLRRRKRAAK